MAANASDRPRYASDRRLCSERVCMLRTREKSLNPGRNWIPDWVVETIRWSLHQLGYSSLYSSKHSLMHIIGKQPIITFVQFWMVSTQVLIRREISDFHEDDSKIRYRHYSTICRTRNVIEMTTMDKQKLRSLYSLCACKRVCCTLLLCQMLASCRQNTIIYQRRAQNVYVPGKMKCAW